MPRRGWAPVAPAPERALEPARVVTFAGVVMELRRKLEVDPAKPRHFYTVRKTGYRFTPG